MMQKFFKSSKEEEFIPIDTLRPGCWIHLQQASLPELEELASLLQLEVMELQDALDKYEIPRVEKIGQTVLIFIRHPIEHELGLYTTTLTFILHPLYFATIAPGNKDLVKQFLSQKTKLASQQKSKLLLALLLKVSHEFTLHIRRVRYNVLKQEKEIGSVGSEDITILTRQEEILNQYHSTLIPLRHVIEDLSSGRYITLSEKEADLLSDLLNTIHQSEDLCNMSLRSIRSLRDSYQIIFTNHVTKTIKRLTALTILFSIPTMIASLYGMNMDLPFASKPEAFLYVLGITGFFTIGAIFIFQKKEWL